MSIDASALRAAKKAMQKRPLHCTRTDEIDDRGGRLETTSMMWYHPPRTKDSSWVQVTCTDFSYSRTSSGNKRYESWHTTTLHIEFAENAEESPTVVVHTYRHNFPSMIFDNHESRIVGRARTAHWTKKASGLTPEIQELASYARRRREQNFTRALMSAHEQVRRFEERRDRK